MDLDKLFLLNVLEKIILPAELLYKRNPEVLAFTDKQKNFILKFCISKTF